ncbi:MAG TPA: M23 family metallopeptidase [Bryobacteraceae bacterium]|nr:M23 family metallopeptidase [Bryobacteraceae bacterium]
MPKTIRKSVLFAVAALIVFAALSRHLREPFAELLRAAAPLRVLTWQAQPPDRVLLMPVEGVPVHRVANTWHAPRSGNRRHEGQDIFAPKGTPVVSASEGHVVRIGQNGLGGNTVWVAGRGGRGYYYAHLDRYRENLSVGDRVYPGTVLGYVGNTGNARSTPPHLHFGMYTAGGASNPLPLLVNRSVSRLQAPAAKTRVRTSGKRSTAPSRQLS